MPMTIAVLRATSSARRMRNEMAPCNCAPVGRRCAGSGAAGAVVVIVEVIAAGCFASFYRRRFVLAPGLCSGSVPGGSRLIWLDSPVDSSSCDVGGFSLCLFRRKPDESGSSAADDRCADGGHDRSCVRDAAGRSGGLAGARRLGASSHRPAVQQPPERSVVGTLDRVDAAATELVVNTTSGKQTFRLQAGATIRRGSKTIKPSELAAHKGERVKVRYRESGGVRRAEWIVLATPAPKPPKTSEWAAGELQFSERI